MKRNSIALAALLVFGLVFPAGAVTRQHAGQELMQCSGYMRTMRAHAKLVPGRNLSALSKHYDGASDHLVRIGPRQRRSWHAQGVAEARGDIDRARRVQRGRGINEQHLRNQIQQEIRHCNRLDRRY